MYHYPVHKDGNVGGNVGDKEGAKGCSPSSNLQVNPKLQGMTVATHVDDILTRDGRVLSYYSVLDSSSC